MAQFAIPEADAFNGSAPPWIGTCVGGGSVDIYQCIAKAPSLPEDTVIIQSSPVASPNVYVTRLTEVSDPGIHTGHTVRVRAEHSDVVASDLNIELRQGYVSEGSQGTLIDSWTESYDPFVIVTKVRDLSGAAAALITDYKDLYVRLSHATTGTLAFNVILVHLEVPNPASRAIVSWAVLEVPRPPDDSLTVINKVKNFNGPKLLEELATADPDLVPDDLVFAGFDIQPNGYLWIPAATEKDVPPDGVAQPADLRFYYSFTPTATDLVTIDGVLTAHDATQLTADQQLEADNAAALAELAAHYPDFSALSKEQQLGILKVFLSGIAVAAPDGKRYTRLVAFAGS